MKFCYLEEIDSTNKYARENLKLLEDKTVVYTFKQTAGRGRLQRKWNYLGKDNIYASIILKPGKEMKEVYANLTQYLCVTLSQVLEEYCIEPKIKWPNDILVNGKKISGILAEGVVEQNKLEGIVLGFGVNLNASRELLDEIDQPATSLNLEIGMPVDCENFLKKLIDKFCLMYDSFIGKGFLLIKEDYLKRTDFLNKTVTIRVFDKYISGVCSGITDTGGLKLIENNREHVFLMGDIL